MMSQNQLYQLPSDLKYFALDDYDVPPPFDPALTVIDFGANRSQSTRYMTAYRWCYLDRLSFYGTTSKGKKWKEVNLSSHCPQRTEIVSKIIKNIFFRLIKQPIPIHISTVFDWIDKHNRGGDLLTLELAKGLYQDYTNDLRHYIQLSNVGDKKTGAIGYGYASRNQLAMASICSAATGLLTDVVRSWAYRIPIRASGPSRVLPAPKTTEDEHVLAHALHTRFFSAFSDAILNNMSPPVVIDLTDLGFEDLVFYKPQLNSVCGWSVTTGKNPRGDWTSHFYRPEGVFPGSFHSFNDLLVMNNIEPLVNKKTYSGRQRAAQNFSEGDLEYMANVATRHFGYLLLAEAGSNASTLATVDCSKVRLDKALGASRLLAVKGRAGYEKQDQLVDLRFTKTVWKRYLELREWMVQRLRVNGLNTPENGLFLFRWSKTKEDYYPLNATNIKTLSLWPKNAPSLRTRDLRKHKIVNALDHTGGNVALVSGLQQVSAQTVERHYAFKNVIEATREMTAYFDAQAKSSALRHAGVPIRIMGKGDDTSTGHCDAPKTEGPQLVEGFEAVGIEPRCEAPLTCLFCVHFGMHATEEDLLRLLTIKRWIEVQTRLYTSNINEGFTKYVPYIDRIDQVFDELPNSYEGFAKTSIRAKALFENGKRDPFWHAKINALLDMEGV